MVPIIRYTKSPRSAGVTGARDQFQSPDFWLAIGTPGTYTASMSRLLD
jgi:hypothetical protein